MKTPPLPLFPSHCLTLAALLLTPTLLRSAPSAPPAKPLESLFNSNAIPRSLYITPTNSMSGRDPFFPNRGVSVLTPQPQHPANAVVLVLNGLSGSADHRLVIINGRTLAEGEEAGVNTANGSVRIRCVEIKKDSVIIEVAGERRELRLRD
jgi:hypothetical protein